MKLRTALALLGVSFTLGSLVLIPAKPRGRVVKIDDLKDFYGAVKAYGFPAVVVVYRDVDPAKALISALAEQAPSAPDTLFFTLNASALSPDDLADDLETFAQDDVVGVALAFSSDGTPTKWTFRGADADMLSSQAQEQAAQIIAAAR